jgi:hypothetical protein
MGLIRITHNSSGIEEYLEQGQKLGRKEHRNQIDKRVHLAGDLDLFSQTINHTRKTKKWKHHYWHITNSLSVEDNEIANETLIKINEEMLQYYFPLDYQDLIYHAEAHRPKIQHIQDKKTLELKQRLIHFHTAIAKYNPLTGNQMRMIPYSHEADKAFQQYLNQKFGTTTPMPRIVPKDSTPVTKKDFISSIDGEYPVDKQTQTTTLRNIFSKLINNASSLDDAKKMLADQEYVKNIRWVETKKYKYFKVETIFDKNINCRGKGFEELEKLYYTPNGLLERIKNKQYKEKVISGELPPEPIKSIEENKVIWKKHQDWWIEQLEQRIPTKKIIKRKSKFKKIVKKFENYYEKYSRQQRIYFVLYKNEIEERIIHGYKIWEDNNTKYLVNPEEDIKIYDQYDQITVAYDNDDPIKRKEAVRLALAIAVAKGWNLDDIEATGSFEFVSEVKQQISQLKSNEKKTKLLDDDRLKNVSFSPDEKKRPPKKHNIEKSHVKNIHPQKNKVKRLNYISQVTDDLNERKQQQLSKEQIKEIKQNLNPKTVIDYAKTNYKLLADNFFITDDNKINDIRTKAKPKSLVDFLTKICNIPFSESMTILDGLYQKQLDKTIPQKIIEPPKIKEVDNNIVKADITKEKQKNEIVNNLIKKLSLIRVVNHICFENNLDDDFFSITKDNKIIDNRSNTTYTNILEFVKVFEKLSNKEAINFLNQFLLKQQNSQKTDKNIGKKKVSDTNPSEENSSVSQKQPKIKQPQNIKDNEKIIDNALEDAINRRKFISNLKDITQNKNVSFKKNLLKIGNETLVLGVDTKITKAEILQIFKNNTIKYSEDIENK